MLEFYAHRRSLYMGYALKICGCPYQSEDLVQDMFIKIHGILQENPEKEIGDSYIYLILRSLYIDNLRREREQVDITCLNLEAEDQDRESIDRVSDILSSMDLLDHLVLIASFEYSLKDLEKIIPARRETIWRWRSKAAKIFKEKWENHAEPVI